MTYCRQYSKRLKNHDNNQQWVKIGNDDSKGFDDNKYALSQMYLYVNDVSYKDQSI